MYDPFARKIAFQFIPHKKWWQYLMFWKKFTQNLHVMGAKVSHPSNRTMHNHNIRNVKIYRQKDQSLTHVDDIERDCEYIGTTPHVVLEAGVKYYAVATERDFIANRILSVEGATEEFSYS